MKERARNIYRMTEKFYREVYDELAKLADEVKDETELPEMVDAAFAMREAEKLAKRIQVRMKANQEQAERKACHDAIEVYNSIEPIRTEYATGTPDMEMNVRVPSRKKELQEYARMMEALGIPRELWDRGQENSPAVDVHWPGMVSMITERAAAGLPLPEGLGPNRTSVMYRLNLRRRRGVLEDAEK